MSRPGLFRVSLIRVVVLAVTGLVLIVVGSSLLLWLMGRGSVVTAGSDLPDVATVIVPGARVLPGGRPSHSLMDRLDAAYAELGVGRVQHILVSGDNRTDRYNEPEAMQAYLVDRGVDAEQITMDFAGLDTWDTCLRAHNQFGLTSAVFVTQDVYANRAASLCRAAGIDVTVLAVPQPGYGPQKRMLAAARERLASVKAVGDIVRKPDSHHQGPFVGLVSSRQQLDEIAESK